MKVPFKQGTLCHMFHAGEASLEMTAVNSPDINSLVLPGFTAYVVMKHHVFKIHKLAS